MRGDLLMNTSCLSKLSREEIQTLKDEIKIELLKEIRRTSQLINPNWPWKEVKAFILNKLEKFPPYDQYQLLTAVSAIIRYSLKLRRVRDMSIDQVEDAKKIALKVLETLPKEE